MIIIGEKSLKLENIKHKVAKLEFVKSFDWRFHKGQ